jgi:hypothetical protein
MILYNELKNVALQLPEVIEAPHFDKTSFRVNNKIFLTYDAHTHTANIKLSPIQQSVYCEIDEKVIYPVPNKWGQQGWTILNLSLINERLLKEAIQTAYCEIAPKKLANLVIKNLSNNFDETPE